ncbi:MAG: hypothetical protein ACYC8T_01740 [Myxococcaceae bacterium]
MRLLYLFIVISLGAAMWLGLSASDAYDAAAAARASNETLRSELQGLAGEVAALEQVEPSPLRYSDDALSEFFSRTVEAGEVLGAGVRVEPGEAALGSTTMVFSEFRQGIQVCQVTLQAAMEGDQAPAILAMFEEELADLPVAVRKLTARKVGRDVAVTMNVDVLGRTR